MKASLFAAVFFVRGALGDPQGYDPLESGSSFIQMPTDTTDPFSFGVLLEASCEHLSCISARYISITAPSSTIYALYTVCAPYNIIRKLLSWEYTEEKGTANSINIETDVYL